MVRSFGSIASTVTPSSFNREKPFMPSSCTWGGGGGGCR